jgi:hypothetical protein
MGTDATGANPPSSVTPAPPPLPRLHHRSPHSNSEIESVSQSDRPVTRCRTGDGPSRRGRGRTLPSLCDRVFLEKRMSGSGVERKSHTISIQKISQSRQNRPAPICRPGPAELARHRNQINQPSVGRINASFFLPLFLARPDSLRKIVLGHAAGPVLGRTSSSDVQSRPPRAAAQRRAFARRRARASTTGDQALRDGDNSG